MLLGVQYRFLPLVKLIGILEGVWLMLTIPGQTYAGELPKLSAEQEVIKNHLQQNIQYLAGHLGERNIWHYENLQAAANYIKRSFIAQGYQPKIQSYEVEGKAVQNVAAELKGAELASEIIIVGAHYDTILGSPGANDNGSGVAALIELAGLLVEQKLARTVRFVAFVNEEPPFFQTPDMGSHVYASRAKELDEHIVAMLAIETIGYYSNEKGSQKYPLAGLELIYPNVGNFIGFVANLASFPLLQKIVGSFRSHTQFPSEGIAAPMWLQGASWSDQYSFWQQGYPGIMVTDTALFRYPYYHSKDDTPNKIDYSRTARVIDGLAKVVVDIAEESTLNS